MRNLPGGPVTRRSEGLYLLSPHLHTHVVLANVGRGPEGAWTALDGRGVYAHMAAAGAVYQAQLRHELTGALGVQWGPLRHGRADVVGIGEEARREFSRRSQEIAGHLATRGLSPDADGGRPSWRASSIAGVVTRAPKDLDTSAEDFRPLWRDRARAVGLGPRRLDAVLDRVVARDMPDRFDPDAVASALVDVRGPDRAFARRDVVRAWSGSLPYGAPAAVVGVVADRFMAEVRGEDGASRDAPGVGERRVELPGHLRDRQLERCLELPERRGRGPEEREQNRGAGHRHGRSVDLGLGLGLG